MSDYLAWIVLGAVIFGEAFAVGYRSDRLFAKRPFLYSLSGAIALVAAVWLSIRTVL